MNMDNDLVVHTRLVDRPDSEQLDPFFLETPLEWRNLEALVSVTVSCVFVFVFFFLVVFRYYTAQRRTRLLRSRHAVLYDSLFYMLNWMVY